MARSRGLGDSIHKLTRATGINKVVHKVNGSCGGCGRRRTTLNKMFPYKGQSTGKTNKNRVVGPNKR